MVGEDDGPTRHLLRNAGNKSSALLSMWHPGSPRHHLPAKQRGKSVEEHR